MPRLHDDDMYYHDPDYSFRHRSSMSPHRASKHAHALDKDHLYEGRNTAKSALVPRHDTSQDSYDGGRPRRGHGHHGGNRHSHSEERPGRFYREPDLTSRRRSSDRYQTLDGRGRDRRPRQGEPDHGRPRRHSHGGGSNRSGLTEAAISAAAAGLVEAIRARHDSNQSARAVTAAMGAAAVDTLVNKGEDGKRRRNVAESALGGLAIERIANMSSRR